MNRKAITFLEIVIAVTILAIAMIPLFGLMSRGAVETDRNASQAFAINKAAEILDTMLDTVPFAAIRQGNPGFIKVDDISSIDRYSNFTQDWARRVVPMMFPGSAAEGAGWPCRGIVTDSRGIHYLVHMKVEDVTSTIGAGQRPETMNIGSGFPSAQPNDFSQVSDMTFSFLNNPAALTDGTWIVDYASDINEAGKPLTEIELDAGSGVAQAPGNIYLDQVPAAQAGGNGFLDPVASRFTARMIAPKVPYSAPEDQSYVPMKRLIVQIQWNLNQRYYSQPETDEGQVQRIHLMTLKGNID